MVRIFLNIAVLFIFIPYLITGQNIAINEFMSSNVSTTVDEDGEYSDWIEIYNPTSSLVNLSGYSLTDNLSEPGKWIFQNSVIQPDSFLIVFASGKDRQIGTHFETYFDWGDEWNYFIGLSEPPTNWKSEGFDDHDWLTGPSGFGYGDGDDATIVTDSPPDSAKPISVFIRNEFILENSDDIIKGYLHIDYDDAFVAYINGIEFARANIGVPNADPPAYNDLAQSAREATMYSGGEPDEIIIDDIQNYIHDGTNVIAIQVHNASEFSSDMTLIPFFTLSMTTIPENASGSSDYLDFPEFKLHSNFAIDSNGEDLALFNSNGDMIDHIQPAALSPDISLGRKPDGSFDLFFFDVPTPGMPNISTGFTEASEDVSFSYDAGFYSSPFNLELSVQNQNSQIYYSLDGSLPTDSSMVYQNSIFVDSITVIRARAYSTGSLPGNVISKSYFINKEYELPVISLITDPKNLWSDESGIYILGPNADMSDYPYWGANFWQDWERPAHLEFFEPDESLGFSLDAGIQIFGSWSRIYPQKSLAVYARGKYGVDVIEHQIFPSRSNDVFQSFIMRNSGQDWGRTFFRDALIHSLAEGTIVDYMEYRPAYVYFNGQPMGIFNLREKMSEHYIESNHGVDPDELDMIERDVTLLHGDMDHYYNFINFLNSNDLSVNENYEYVKTLMDVDNFMDYMIIRCYAATSDWPWNNVKIWRQKSESGRWRWLLYDTDYGFYGGHLSYASNMFNEVRGQSNTHTSFIFFKLFENEQYRNRFINRYADLLNGYLSSGKVLQKIDDFISGIETAMPFHIDKWQYTFNEVWWLGKSIDSMEEWYENIAVAENFAEQRPYYVRENIINEFGLENGIGALIISQPSGNGKIKINSIVIDEYPFTGIYFKDIPVRLEAVPDDGNHFSNWIGSESESRIIEINIGDATSITASFEAGSISEPGIVINEINYNSAGDFDTEDWVELYNNSETEIDVSGYVFKDEDDTHEFIFPAGSKLGSGEYIVIAADTVKFKSLFPDVENLAGQMFFGLSGSGEHVRLFDNNMNIVDSLTYDDKSPWPVEADGDGASLALKNPDLNNADPANWAASISHGTPGKINDVYTKVERENLIPQEFDLLQNYPNPFNPETNIKFNLPKDSNVKLIIYNILGEAVNTLLSKNMKAGFHSVVWNGKNDYGLQLASGVYFYSLSTEGFSSVKKMILLR
ncbi:MAG: CotH kinase family protein [Melioribacteraceae bacterium]|nr:CotH kinase family protein [Melioribacteraceae bacterium]MCF8353145.1 CotH kinase family protein [Melioribacteraceae bacterium]MCF8393155.1 CotH kinase family protein [Melioribacteraceae bacterium]MCF8418058.1 CotH kinase family protein [Melioribacteraceae bacterium]